MSTINNSTPGNRPLPDGELTVDITRPNRQLSDAAMEELEARRVHEAEQRAREARNRPDKIEVSSEARLMLAKSQASHKDEATERKQRVDALRQEYLEGTLGTKARVDKAAAGLLGA